ncbi:MAG: hypothetical protein LBL46_02910 [Rickettsiales bacterium]|jgi:hypothetical protein|nr:hypothetical protein [Rickettsiales bacterium]
MKKSTIKRKLSAEEVLDIYEAIAFANSQGRIFNVYAILQWPKDTTDDDAVKLFEEFKKSCFNDLIKKHNALYAHAFARIPSKGICTKIFLSTDNPDAIKKRIMASANTKTGKYSYTLPTCDSGYGAKWQWGVFKDFIKEYEAENVFIQDDNGTETPIGEVFIPAKRCGEMGIKMIANISHRLKSIHRNKVGFTSMFWELSLNEMKKGGLWTDKYFKDYQKNTAPKQQFDIDAVLDFMDKGDE